MPASLKTLLPLLAALFWAITLTPDHQNRVQGLVEQADYAPPTLPNQMAPPDGLGGSGVPPEVLSAAAAAVASSEEELDGAATPAAVEAVQIDAALAAEPPAGGAGGGEGGEAGAAGLGAPTLALTTLKREYIWGPGDSVHAGLDELLVMFDEARFPWWPVQDGGGDVVASAGVPEPWAAAGGTNVAVVAAQWQYDAYGALISSELFATGLESSPGVPRATPTTHVGHKGLFVDRLDAGVVDPATFADRPRQVPYAHAVYHVRNRAYQPALGRWMQQDPNATAMSLIEASAHSGRGMDAIALAFDAESRYGDGYNLYEYLGSNPWNRSDPMGLSWDPFDMVDEYVTESAGAKAAFLERVVGGAKVATFIGLQIIAMLPFPVTALAADIGASALEGEMPPAIKMAGKVMGFLTLASLARSISKIGYAAGKAAAKYFATHGWRGVVKLSLAPYSFAWKHAQRLARKATGGACGCFVAGTLVWTSTGLIPIEDVRIGDMVLTQDESTGGLEVHEVTDEIVIEAAALLDVTLHHQDGAVEVIRTTDEHPFWVESPLVIGRKSGPTGWRRADGLRPGEQVRTLTGTAFIESLSFTGERQTVYNLTVHGRPNYHVGPDGVLVHTVCHFVF